MMKNSLDHVKGNLLKMFFHVHVRNKAVPSSDSSKYANGSKHHPPLLGILWHFISS